MDVEQKRVCENLAEYFGSWAIDWIRQTAENWQGKNWEQNKADFEKCLNVHTKKKGDWVQIVNDGSYCIFMKKEYELPAEVNMEVNIRRIEDMTPETFVKAFKAVEGGFQDYWLRVRVLPSPYNV